MKTFCVLLLSLSAAYAAAPAAAPLRFDGLYEQNPPVIDSSDNEHRWYLRFYEDGVVVQKETIVAPEKWTSRLERENEKVSRGTYKLDGRRLTWEFAPPEGRFSTGFGAEGVVLPDGALKLSVKITGYFDGKPGSPVVQERTYAFTKLPAPKK